MQNKGYIHIYTGNGKGKSTAAFGLAVRALCAGKNVFIGQFVKSMKYSETRIEQLFTEPHSGLGKVQIEQLGRGCFIDKNPEQIDIDMAEKGLLRCFEAIDSGQWDVVILDELTIATYFHLLKTEDIVQRLERRNPTVEIVITGRYAPQELIDIADLVTEMKEVKHYYQQGVLSREGIDR